MKLQITNKYGPNITLVLPGRCNANCNFCFWDREQGNKRVPSDYFTQVFETLGAVSPSIFRSLSISGGEPSLSPVFYPMLRELRNERYRTERLSFLDRVVLTSNGVALDQAIQPLGLVVDHLNISRHGVTDQEAADAFGVKRNFLGIKALKELIKKIHDQTNVDVTLNCVINNQTTIAFIDGYLDMAERVGADAVSFRKAASTVTPTRVEKAFVKKWGPGVETDCPVCRGRVINRGFGPKVRWKGSVMEPSVATNGVYELIIQPNGKVYADWSYQHELSHSDIRKLEPYRVKALPPEDDADDEERFFALSLGSALKGGGCGGLGGAAFGGGCGGGGGSRGGGCGGGGGGCGR